MHIFRLITTLEKLGKSRRILLRLFMVQTDDVRLYFSATERKPYLLHS
jgi:hypothetical protein